MGFLQEKCSFGFFTQQKAVECKAFHCGDDDLDEFFLHDASRHGLSTHSTRRVVVSFLSIPTIAFGLLDFMNAMVSIVYSVVKNKSGSFEVSSLIVPLIVV